LKWFAADILIYNRKLFCQTCYDNFLQLTTIAFTAPFSVGYRTANSKTRPARDKHYSAGNHNQRIDFAANLPQILKLQTTTPLLQP
jgi:hypothetical protein